MLTGIFSKNDLARERWYHLKPKLLYLFQESWRPVQSNEFGRVLGPRAAFELAAAYIYKQEGV